MKRLNRVLFAATVALGLAAAGQAVAQSQLSGPNGTAMSPNLRRMLAEPPAQAIVVAAPQQPTVWPSGVNTANVAASPKQQQLMAQSQTVARTHEPVVAAYQPTGSDGITASPKLRQMMEQNAAQFQIAPLK
jgi:hypothetical protein